MENLKLPRDLQLLIVFLQRSPLEGERVEHPETFQEFDVGTAITSVTHLTTASVKTDSAAFPRDLVEDKEFQVHRRFVCRGLRGTEEGSAGGRYPAVCRWRGHPGLQNRRRGGHAHICFQTSSLPDV